MMGILERKIAFGSGILRVTFNFLGLVMGVVSLMPTIVEAVPSEFSGLVQANTTSDKILFRGDVFDRQHYSFVGGEVRLSPWEFRAGQLEYVVQPGETWTIWLRDIRSNVVISGSTRGGPLLERRLLWNIGELVGCLAAALYAGAGSLSY